MPGGLSGDTEESSTSDVPSEVQGEQHADATKAEVADDQTPSDYLMLFDT